MRAWIALSLIPLIPAGASVGAGASSDELVQASTSVVCQGNRCGGGGGSMNRNYSWQVTPQAGTWIDRIDVGVDTNTPFISGVVAPNGWSYTYNLNDPTNHQTWPTAHGTVTSINGSCPMVMRWTGPAMNTSFEIAFNGPQHIHVAEWDTPNGAVANWGRPVGMGAGPVHAPKGGWVPVQDDEEHRCERALR